MNNSHVPEPFRSILNEVREATQTLANCAALGPLQKDGTRMPIKRQRAYDSQCEDLAEAFLADHKPFTDEEKQDLAQTIQDAIEDWLFAARHEPDENDESVARERG